MRSNSTRAKVLKSLISLSPYVQDQLQLVELSGFLSSTKDVQALGKIAQRIENPVGRLYEVLSRNDYSDPQAFSVTYLPDCYMGMSLVCSAQALRSRGELRLAFRVCLEGLKASKRWGDAVSVYQAQKELAILQSLHGNHKSSLELLENTLPLVRSIAPRRPALYYDHFNSLAVELCEFGRIEEARINVQFALASPFADKYPGTYETARDIAAKTVRASREVVSVGEIKSPGILIEYDFAGRGGLCEQTGEKAKVLELKGQTRKDQTNKEQANKLSPREKEKEVLRRIADTDLTEQELDELLRILRRDDTKQNKNS